MYLLLVVFACSVLALPDQSQSCITNLQIPFTGYKVEYQLNIQSFSGDYHLLYCNDNKLINDINLNKTIPWTKPVTFHQTETSQKSLILARRKTFALRSIPIFLPNTLVGSLYLGDAFRTNNNASSSYDEFKSMPLIAANILRNWLEVNYRLQMIYHIPILTTPGIDSKRYNFGFFSRGNNDWNKYISMSEGYNFSSDSRMRVRRDFDSVLNYIQNVFDGHLNLTKKLKQRIDGSDTVKLWWKVITLSKLVNNDLFATLIIKMDRILRY